MRNVICVILMFFLMSVCLAKATVKVMLERQYSKEIGRVIKDQELDSLILDIKDLTFYNTECLIRNMIRVESNFNNYAEKKEERLKDSSYGLMQVTCNTARTMGFKEECKSLYDPYKNIFYGVKYLLIQLDKQKGDLKRALAAYNAGDVYICKRGLGCKIGEPVNQQYVNTIMRLVKDCESH